MIRTLLLNNDFQIIAFIAYKKAIKLLLKGKAELISVWFGKKIYYSSGLIDHPATIKMKYCVSLQATKLVFSRKLVLRRDNYRCAYCLNKYYTNNLTIDHIIPKSVGGTSSFSNCITACLPCNRKKANKTPEQAGMTLKFQPIIPNEYLCYLPGKIEWHDDWFFFV